MSNSVRPHRRQPTRLPSPWDSPGKNTAVGCHFLLQGIFLIQESNLSLLHCRQILYHLSHQGSHQRREYQEFEISIYKLLCIKDINNKVLLYSTVNYIQYPVINHNGKEYEKEYICVKPSHFAIQQRLAQIVNQLCFNFKKKREKILQISSF